MSIVSDSILKQFSVMELLLLQSYLQMQRSVRTFVDFCMHLQNCLCIYRFVNRSLCTFVNSFATIIASYKCASSKLHLSILLSVNATCARMQLEYLAQKFPI